MAETNWLAVIVMDVLGVCVINAVKRAVRAIEKAASFDDLGSLEDADF